MYTIPTRPLIVESVRCSTDLHYIYLNNAKCGCSTIKQALWATEFAAGRVDALPTGLQIHGAGFWRFKVDISDEAAARFFKFSFVRNPYHRLLSCYLDKIRGAGPVRTRFCVQHGLPLDQGISFETFVDVISQTMPNDDDQHWRRQEANILAACVNFDFLGYVENFQSDFEHVRSTLGLAGESRFSPHATGASSKLDQYMTPKIAALVQRKYAIDFATFGYAEDYRVHDPVAPLKQLRVATPAGSSYLAGMLAETLPSKEHLIETAMATQPGSEIAYELMLAKLGTRKPVVDDLTASLRTWPDDPRLNFLQAQVFAQQGRAEEALGLYDQIIRQHKHEVAYLQGRARLLAGMGRVADARSTAQKAVELAPWNAEMVALASDA